MGFISGWRGRSNLPPLLHSLRFTPSVSLLLLHFAFASLCFCFTLPLLCFTLGWRIDTRWIIMVVILSGQTVLISHIACWTVLLTGFWDIPQLLRSCYITSPPPKSRPPLHPKRFFPPWDTTDRCRKTENSAGHWTWLFALGKALLLKLKKEGVRDRNVLAWCEVESGNKNFVKTAAEGWCWGGEIFVWFEGGLIMCLIIW